MSINEQKKSLEEVEYIITEAIASHNRNYDVANGRIDAVTSAKADAVRFQTYIDGILYSMRC